MKRFMRLVIDATVDLGLAVIVAAVLVCGISSCAREASACDRCGHRGAACVFSKPKHVPLAAKQQVDKTVVVNTFIGVPVPTHYGSIAAQGNTVWGYGSDHRGLGAFAEAYGQPIDNAVLAGLAGKLIDRAGAAFNSVALGIREENADRGDVARILARGQADSQVISATRQESATASTRQTYRLEVTADAATGEYSVRRLGEGGDADLIEPRRPEGRADNAPPELQGVSGLARVLENRCNACHDQEQVRDLRGLADWSREEIDAVIDRLETDDETRHMPKGGEPLSRDDMQEFYAARKQATSRAAK
jgi:hypothetical protein